MRMPLSYNITGYVYLFIINNKNTFTNPFSLKIVELFEACNKAGGKTRRIDPLFKIFKDNHEKELDRHHKLVMASLEDGKRPRQKLNEYEIALYYMWYRVYRNLLRFRMANQKLHYKCGATQNLLAIKSLVKSPSDFNNKHILRCSVRVILLEYSQMY